MIIKKIFIVLLIFLVQNLFVKGLAVSAEIKTAPEVIQSEEVDIPGKMVEKRSKNWLWAVGTVVIAGVLIGVYPGKKSESGTSVTSPGPDSGKCTDGCTEIKW